MSHTIEQKERARRLAKRITEGYEFTEGMIRSWISEVIYLPGECREYVWKIIRTDRDFPKESYEGLRRLYFDYWNWRRSQ